MSYFDESETKPKSGGRRIILSSGGGHFTLTEIETFINNLKFTEKAAGNAATIGTQSTL